MLYTSGFLEKVHQNPLYASSHERSFLPRKEIKDYNNDNWVAIDEDVYRKLFKGSSAKRTKFVGLKRNIEQNSNRIS